MVYRPAVVSPSNYPRRVSPDDQNSPTQTRGEPDLARSSRPKLGRNDRKFLGPVHDFCHFDPNRRIRLRRHSHRLRPAGRGQNLTEVERVHFINPPPDDELWLRVLDHGGIRYLMQQIVTQCDRTFLQQESTRSSTAISMCQHIS